MRHTTALSNQRLIAIDILRGAVMVLMTLDHTRDFFSNIGYAPTDLSKTSVSLFLTRWITHFCAPVFIFLAGTSAYLFGVRHPDKRYLSRFLLTRGLWIVFLGITFESLIWCFTPDFSEISGAVLWAIGWSMVALAALVFLPVPVIAIFGLIMVASHNLFDGLTGDAFGGFGFIWAILHSGETVQITDRIVLYPFYPLIPWIGVMALGYGFGRLLSLNQAVQRKTLVGLGSAMILLFILLRYSNYYGDPQPWFPQNTTVFTVLSFIHCEKYPPSLLYLLMTLGPVIALMPALEQSTHRFSSVLVVFGRTPMFFYLLHLPVIVLLSLGLALITGHSDFISPDRPFLDGFPQAYGYGLPVVYLVWAFVVAALYPVCRWFYSFKRQQQSIILKYL